MYPDKKQIEKKTADLLKTMRNYIRGVSPAYAVEQEFRCLFTDLSLEVCNEIKGTAERMNFPSLIKEWLVLQEVKC